MEGSRGDREYKSITLFPFNLDPTWYFTNLQRFSLFNQSIIFQIYAVSH